MSTRHLVVGILAVLILQWQPSASADERYGIGAWLTSTASSWEWGPEYQPYGNTPVQLGVEVYTTDLPGIEPLFPCLEWDPECGHLDSVLIEVNGESVYYPEGEAPIFMTPPMSYTFTFEVTPKDGYAWPTERFTLSAGGKGWYECPGGNCAYPAIRAHFIYYNPYKECPQTGPIDTDWYIFDAEGRFGDQWVIPLKGYTFNQAEPYYLRYPGLWVKEDDVIYTVVDDEMTFRRNESCETTNGDGFAGYDSFRLLPDIQTMALIGAVVDQQGNYTLLESAGSPGGFVGAGVNVLTAPATGFVGFRLNEHSIQFYDHGGFCGPYDPWEDSFLDFTVVAVRGGSSECDVNSDGELNDADVAAFVANLLGSPLNLNYACGGDFDGDGYTTGDDIQAFMDCLLGNAAPSQQITWLPVGDAGNTDDDTCFGGVDYAYEIAEYEVTNGQYINFLNAVAADGDPNGLYHIDMAGTYGGINRSGSGMAGDQYVYGPRAGDTSWLARPVNYVNWYDALRFANWMHNGQPTGGQDVSTTEDGAYDMSLGAGVVRKPGALVFLPTEDEWYKAAYYKGGGASAGYWEYTTESDTVPTAEAPPGTDMTSGSANCDNQVGAQTDVGAYTARPSDSAYGTFDQNGNLWEWNEASIGSNRGLRGGAFDSLPYVLAASHRDYLDPTHHGLNCGFRVARVPSGWTEPITWLPEGDAGNVNDDTGYGGVDYAYEIAEYEVTNGQYINFLNAVAADGDPNGLYHIDLAGTYGGINRNGSGTVRDPYVYEPKGGDAAWLAKPVNFVDWYDALRFANWMHNGQPTGGQDVSSTEDGAYDMSLGAGVVRKPGALVFLPTEDEWYKAAYYKGGGTSAGYWDYSTESDTIPTAEVPPGTDMTNGSANCDNHVGAQTDVGAYTARPSDSAYGTFDQNGNVWEWNEALIGSNRGLRGGAFDSLPYVLEASHRDYLDPTHHGLNCGFRVARVPG